MQQIKLGRNGPMVSAFGLGCMGMSGIYGPADDAGIHRHHPRGARRRHFAPSIPATSTAWATMRCSIRDALRGGKREAAFIMVKCGSLRSPDGKIVGDDARPQSIKNFLSYSLRRLGTDYIDLYQPSRVDPQVPIEDTIGAIADMVKAGYVRHIGVSEASAKMIWRAAGGASDRGPANRILAVLRPRHRTRDFTDLARTRHRAGCLWRPFQRADQRPARKRPGPRRANCARGGRGFSPRTLPRIIRSSKLWAKSRATRASQRKRSRSPGSSKSRGDDVVPLIGARRRDQLKEALRAADLKLSADDLARIERAAPADAVAGSRYMPAVMAHMDSEHAG